MQGRGWEPRAAAGVGIRDPHPTLPLCQSLFAVLLDLAVYIKASEFPLRGLVPRSPSVDQRIEISSLVPGPSS